MRNTDKIVLPEPPSIHRMPRTFSNLDSTSDAGRDLTILIGDKIVVEEVLVDKHFEVVSIHKKKKQRWLDYSGRGVAFFFAVGCGVTAAAALATLVSGPLFYVLAGVLCLSTTYANYRMTNHDVSNIFVGGIKGIFQKKIVVETEGDVESADKKTGYLSPAKMLLLGGGVVLSLSFGMVFGALTYGSTLGLVAAFGFLGAVSAALPPIGIVLGALTFICLSCLMIKAFSDLVKTENLKDKVKTKIVNMFSRDPIRDAGKSSTRFFIERALVGLSALTLVAGTLGLIIWGQISTLMNCAREFGKILTTVTHASMGVVNLVSNIIGVGCALVAQIPFILKTSVQPIIKLFSRSNAADEPPLETTLSEKAKSVLLVVTSALSAAATGAIALAGKSLNVLAVLAGAGAFLNNFLGSVVNAVISQPLPAGPEKVPQLSIDTKKETAGFSGSTATINFQLQHDKKFVFDRSPKMVEDYFHPDRTPSSFSQNEVAEPQTQASSAAANDAAPPVISKMSM
jgi:hypothetical protein